MRYFYPFVILVTIASAVSPTPAEIVFFDDFEVPDMLLVDHPPVVGGAWRMEEGYDSPYIAYGIVDSEGIDRRCFADFTRALGAGEVMTVTVDAAQTILGTFFPEGYAGVSLYVGTSEAAFIGSPWYETSWGLDQAITGVGIQLTTETDEDATAVVTYVYDTGDWSMTVTGLDGVPEMLSGTGTPHLAFDNLRIANGNEGIADMAIDLIEVDMSNYDPEGPVLQVDRETGQVALINANAVGSIEIAGYQVTSSIGALNSVAWKSIAENYDADSGGGIDPVNIWTVTSETPAEVAESTTGAATLTPGATVDLGPLWVQHPNEELGFSITVNGQLLNRAPWFVGNDGESYAVGDLNFDGDITVADWGIYKGFMYEDLSGLSAAQSYGRGDFDADGDNDLYDLGLFRDAYDTANGEGAFDAMVAGVPEPAGLVLLLLAAVAIALHRIRRRGCLDLLIAGMVCGTALANLGSTVLAEVIGTDDFSYSDVLIDGQTGGVGFDWDNVSGIHTATTSDWDELWGGPQVVGGALQTQDGGAYRQYNGPTEGADTDPDTDERLGAWRGVGRIYYRVDLTRSGADWGGMSGYDFGTERLFFGVPSGQATPYFGIDESGVGVTMSSVPVIDNQTYTMVSMIDFDNSVVALWIDPTDAHTLESADAVRTYTGTNWNTAVRLASGANAPSTWDNLIVATEFSELGLPETDLLTLQVNTTTGAVSIRNDSGTPITMNGYAILSPGGALQASGWNSLAEQDLAAFPAGDGSGNGWEETGVPDMGYLGEAFLLDQSTFSDQLEVGLGYAFNPSVFGLDNDGDLVFNVRLDSGLVINGIVEYVTGGVVNNADFNGDGNVDGTDFLTWQIGFGLTGTASRVDGDANNDTHVDSADLAIWQNQFGTTAGNADLAGVPVPEPVSVGLLLAGLIGSFCGWYRAHRGRR